MQNANRYAASTQDGVHHGLCGLQWCRVAANLCFTLKMLEALQDGDTKIGSSKKAFPGCSFDGLLEQVQHRSSKE